MSSRSASPSEGEIVETYSNEKATKSLPSAKDPVVDPPSRQRASPSRSPSPYRHSRRRDYRSRSRSPYRDGRGHKRAREDDHYSSRTDRRDPRSFRGRYDDRPHDHRRGNARGSYHDLDRDPGSSADLRYDDRPTNARSREKRPRTVSRSPSRFNDRRLGPKGNTSSDKSRHADGPVRNGELKGSFKAGSKEQSVGKQGEIPSAAASSKTDAEQTKDQAHKGVSFKLGVRGGSDTADNPRVLGKNAEAVASSEPVDEATLIEQRRKRREAIMAKHKAQSNPLLVQALTASTTTTPSNSLPETPSSASQAIDSLQISPPATPREVSGSNSPGAFEIAKDSDLANNSVQANGDIAGDEPSAADYDPTMDMQEDKLRQDNHQQGNNIPAPAYDETQTSNQDALMFDIFAEADQEMSGQAEEAAKPTPAARPKAIDMGMLDDFDDEEGYYKIKPKDLLDNRYLVQAKIGQGMFSAVVRAEDQGTKEPVAIKIIRSNEMMRKTALKEIDILNTLRAADPDGKKHLIRLERQFEHKGHLCMVFENLSVNLREVLKVLRDGINLEAVRAYAQQMFLGLSLLRKCKVIHADLKPDNVLVDKSRKMLKVCDLGSASDASENEITPYLVSRFYRAPEIILGLPYDYAIDTWSVGCTLFELYTGKILFTGGTNNQMLRSIMECRGKFSPKLLRKAEFAPRHFDNLLNFRSFEKDKLTGEDRERVLNFNKPTRDLRTRLLGNAKRLAESEARELNFFVDLLEKCLNLNPERRCTPAEALKHPFIMRSK